MLSLLVAALDADLLDPGAFGGDRHRVPETMLRRYRLDASICSSGDATSPATLSSASRRSRDRRSSSRTLAAREKLPRSTDRMKDRMAAK